MRSADPSLSRLVDLGEVVEEDEGLPANELASGECGLICRIDGDHEDIERLKVMGLCLGRRLHIVKSGDPMIVSVMGTRLGIAERLSGHVFVRRDVEHFCHENEATG